MCINRKLLAKFIFKKKA